MERGISKKIIIDYNNKSIKEFVNKPYKDMAIKSISNKSLELNLLL